MSWMPSQVDLTLQWKIHLLKGYNQVNKDQLSWKYEVLEANNSRVFITIFARNIMPGTY